eukprot:gene2967-3705_t
MATPKPAARFRAVQGDTDRLTNQLSDQLQSHKVKYNHSSQSPVFRTNQEEDLMSLASSTVITQKKYHISFLCQRGHWIACIKQLLPVGYRMFMVPIYGEVGLSIGTLLHSTPHAQKEYIHVGGLLEPLDAGIEALKCIYIRKVRYPDGGMQVEMDKTCNYFPASSEFMELNPELSAVRWENWTRLFNLVGDMMQEIKFTHSILAMDVVEPMKKRLEQAMYHIFNRHVQLDHYPLFYNKLVTQVRNQLRAACQRAGGYVDYSQQVVDVRCKAEYVPALWMEWKQVSLVSGNEKAIFDLDKLCDAFEIRLCKKEASSPYAVDLLNNIELLASQPEELQLSSFPHLSLQSMQASAWMAAPISVAPNVATQRLENPEHIYLEEYDLPSSMHIPRLLKLPSGSTVAVTFGSSLKQPENILISADRLVDQRLIPSLMQALYKANRSVSITSIHISATTNGHDGKQHANSNHRKENGARAIDISKINGRNIIDLAANDPLIIALQNALEEIPVVRENFGPYLRNKNKQPYAANSFCIGFQRPQSVKTCGYLDDISPNERWVVYRSPYHCMEDENSEGTLSLVDMETHEVKTLDDGIFLEDPMSVFIDDATIVRQLQNKLVCYNIHQRAFTKDLVVFDQALELLEFSMNQAKTQLALLLKDAAHGKIYLHIIDLATHRKQVIAHPYHCRDQCSDTGAGPILWKRGHIVYSLQNRLYDYVMGEKKSQRVSGNVYDYGVHHDQLVFIEWDQEAMYRFRKFSFDTRRIEDMALQIPLAIKEIKTLELNKAVIHHKEQVVVNINQEQFYELGPNDEWRPQDKIVLYRTGHLQIYKQLTTRISPYDKVTKIVDQEQLIIESIAGQQ